MNDIAPQAMALLERMQAAFEGERYQEAITLASEMLVLEPTSESAFVVRGESYARLSMPERAIDDFEAFLKRKPSGAPIHHRLGGLLYDDNPKKAHHHFTRAHALTPEVQQYTVDLMSSCFRQEQYDEVVKLGEQALRQWPENADIQSKYAGTLCLLAKGSITPVYSIADVMVSTCYTSKEELENSQRAVEKIKALNSSDTRVQGFLSTLQNDIHRAEASSLRMPQSKAVYAIPGGICLLMLFSGHPGAVLLGLGGLGVTGYIFFKRHWKPRWQHYRHLLESHGRVYQAFFDTVM